MERNDDKAAPLRYNIVGKQFYNNDGSKFTVKATNIKNKRNQTQYICEFESGWTCFAASSDIRKGKVKDMFYPTVHGVGMLGFAGRNAKSKGRIYYLWAGMIRRCYDSTAPFYKWYGARGVTVCDRWKRFDLFLEDAPNIPGYNKDKIDDGTLELDKDLIDPSQKIYSLETCSFVTHRENLEPVIKILNNKSQKKSLSTIRKE